MRITTTTLHGRSKSTWVQIDQIENYGRPIVAVNLHCSGSDPESFEVISASCNFNQERHSAACEIVEHLGDDCRVVSAVDEIEQIIDMIARSR